MNYSNTGVLMSLFNETMQDLVADSSSSSSSSSSSDDDDETGQIIHIMDVVSSTRYLEPRQPIKKSGADKRCIDSVAKCFAIHPVPMRHQRPHQASADVVQQMQGHFSMGSIQAYRPPPTSFHSQVARLPIYEHTLVLPPIEHEVQC